MSASIVFGEAWRLSIKHRSPCLDFHCAHAELARERIVAFFFRRSAPRPLGAIFRCAFLSGPGGIRYLVTQMLPTSCPPMFQRGDFDAVSSQQFTGVAGQANKPSSLVSTDEHSATWIV